jgi:serine/threonine protein kinase
VVVKSRVMSAAVFQILAATDLQMPASFVEFKDMYIFTELMETDMHRVIYSRQRLSEEHIKYFVYQLVCGLRYLHSANVIHRDIKPSNILLNADCKLRLCDFGFARGDSLPGRDETMTEYVVTRWYRAPEVMLSSQHYSSAVDMWSAGCVFAELLGAKALFPGGDYVEQLKLITSVLGSPSEEDMAFIHSDLSRKFMRKLPHRERVPFSSKFPDASPEVCAVIRLPAACAVTLRHVCSPFCEAGVRFTGEDVAVQPQRAHHCR